MISLIRAKRMPSIFERLLWLGIGSISTLMLVFVATDVPENASLDVGVLLFAFGSLVAAIGLLLNWGPLIPSAVIGMIIFAFFTDPLRGTPEEQLIKILGVPAIGAAVGGFVGLLIDFKLSSTGKTARESAKGRQSKSNSSAP